MTDVEKKKVIYLLGCGRSGTTVTSIVLGNGRNCLDLGEVVYFLHKRGQPNEFGEETENGRFWKNVREGVLQEIPDLFEETSVLDLTQIESYASFFPVYFGLVSRKRKQAYSKFINALYRNIAKYANGYECYIDSSKKAGRALLYESLLKECDVYLLHIVRSPVGVVKSMGAKGTQTGNRGFFRANVYYFLVEMACFLVRLRARRNSYLKVRYEDLQRDPQQVLSKISQFTGLDLQPAIEKVVSGEPLEKGNIFNGNRMRMGKAVILKRSVEPYESSFANRITSLVNACWY